MGNPKRAADTPFAVEVESGKSYFWCACGLSQNQPFCDGSHKGTEFTPVKYQATASKKVFFCGCKVTASQPLCDGSHKKPV
ncbi:MAG: CDGSH iron-sulfur domain-containing protein [Pseudomonadota bacterium]|nr:CDGSH iron-sulfur domain-containing protein [Pseudomonadota bacterium]